MSSTSEDPMEEITADLLLEAYAAGIFPMSDSGDDDDLYWVEPKMRGIMPLDLFHIPKSLQKTMRKEHFEIRINQQFQNVLRHCAAPAKGREKTWINQKIMHLYSQLHQNGFGHSVEVYSDNELVGGLYGVALGTAFFGESMFHTKTDASKVALVALVERLKERGFTLLDLQFVTEHLKQFGAIEIPKIDYQILLARALTNKPAQFI